MSGLDKSIQYDFSSSAWRARVEAEYAYLLSNTPFLTSVLGNIPNSIQTQYGGTYLERELRAFDRIVFTDDPSKVGLLPNSPVAAAGRAPGDGALYIYVAPGGYVAPTGRALTLGELIVHELGHYTTQAIDAEQRLAAQNPGLGVQLLFGDEAEQIATQLGDEVAAWAGLAPVQDVTRIRRSAGAEFAPLERVKVPRCFAEGTLILLPNGNSRPIERIGVGDLVMSFDEMGHLRPARVTRLFSGVTDRWVVLNNSTRVTPNHRFLIPGNKFKPIEDVLSENAFVVDAGGIQQQVIGHLILAEHAADSEWIQLTPYGAGNAALQPEPVLGWRTYNFTAARRLG